MQLAPEARGGEMEAAGLYTAASERNIDWIVVKGICDWADGEKQVDKRKRQLIAATNASRFSIRCLSQGGFIKNAD